MLLNAGLLLPFLAFCIVALFTPGPNNIMLMTNGLNFGLRRTIPAILGVDIGFGFLVLCVTLGLGAVFEKYPALYTFMEYLSGLYMLYLAYKIAKSHPAKADAPKNSKPVSFLQAAALQWINPKGLGMTVSMAVTYAGIADYPYNTIILALSSAVLGVGSSVTWAALGKFLQRYLHKPKILRAFNIVMALLLVASLYPLFEDALK